MKHAERIDSRPGLAFLAAIPIALLGGLIGLGGAEFRLPVLAGPLGYPARRAVPLNLAVSLVTLLTALVTRAGSVDVQGLAGIAPVIMAMTAGALVTAFLGPSVTTRISNAALERVILVLLVAIGLALIVESLLPTEAAGLVPGPAQPLVGFALGLAIGLVSSLLGVAGGELIIPSFVFAFGVPIKLAGTASLLVSLPTVAVGIARYWRHGAFADSRALRETRPADGGRVRHRGDHRRPAPGSHPRGGPQGGSGGHPDRVRHPRVPTRLDLTRSNA